MAKHSAKKKKEQQSREAKTNIDKENKNIYNSQTHNPSSH